MEPKYLIIAALSLMGVYALRKGTKRGTADGVNAAVGGYSEEDVTNAARMLMAETAMRRDPQEQAAILWVAINRAKRAHGGKLIPGALTRVLYRPGVPTWNGSGRYQQLFDDASRHTARFARAKEFARQILDGRAYPNKIGPRRHFVHPGGMRRCAASDVGKEFGRKVCTQTTAGPRLLPKWNVDGYADYSVKVIEGARFS